MRRLNILIFGLVIVFGTACNLVVDPITGPVISPGNLTATPGTPAAPVTQTPAELSPEQILNVGKATVQIFAGDEGTGGSFQPTSTGTGAIISADGRIITTCSIACNAPVLLVLMATDINQPPVARYRAQVVSSNESLDMALLQIHQDSTGNAVTAATLNLPFIERGNSDLLAVGDQIRVFAYPGIGASLSNTPGAITGFESGTVGTTQQRVFIRTDANLSAGGTGGTVVDLFGRLVAVTTTVSLSGGQGVSLGSLGLLLPVNLVDHLGSAGSGGSDSTNGDRTPPTTGQLDTFEPNNTATEAAGPIKTGQALQAYISPTGDVDIYYFDVVTTGNITANLTNVPPGVDYDLYVYSGNQVVAKSENEAGQNESIDFRPAAPGRFNIAVSSFQGSNDSQPYSLTVTFDGGNTNATAVNVSGTVMNGATGKPFERGVFGLLKPGVTCSQFLTGGSLDMTKVVGTGTTDANGQFVVRGVAAGEAYTAFFFYGSNNVCQNDWLNIPASGGDINLGVITLSF